MLIDAPQVKGQLESTQCSVVTGDTVEKQLQALQLLVNAAPPASLQLQCASCFWLDGSLPPCALRLPEVIDAKAVELALAHVAQQQAACSLLLKHRRDVLTVQDQIRASICRRHADNGVTLSDLNGTFIDQQVEIAAGVHIGVGVQLRGKTRLLEGSRVRLCCTSARQPCAKLLLVHAFPPNSSHLLQVEGPSVISNSVIGPNSLVRAFCHIEDSTHRGQGFGPFARLRAHSSVDKAYIGNFVEVKNSVIGPGSSLAHFTYSGENRSCSATQELKHQHQPVLEQSSLCMQAMQTSGSK